MRKFEKAEDSPFSPLKEILAAERFSSEDEVKTAVQH
jgi:hypothetical protein